MRRIYLDYAATTPVRPEVLNEMQKCFNEDFGNPSSLHTWGQTAQAAVDKARKILADFFAAEFNGVIFTSSATEANNLIIRGIVRGIKNNELRIKSGKADSAIRNSSFIIPHIVVSAIEHESVLETCKDLEKDGAVDVTYLPVNSQGFVNPEDVRRALKRETVLVSIMAVNNEVGTVQALNSVSQIIQEFKQSKLKPQNQAKYLAWELPYPFFHTDAAQAVGYAEFVKLQELGVDTLTVSSHKIYGPKGAAALVLANGVKPIGYAPLALSPIITGGGQEFGLRSSTENVPALVGFAKALQLARQEQKAEGLRLQNLKNKLKQGILKIYPQAVVNGAEPQTCHILNISFVNKDKEELIYKFDKFGIAISAGSACQAKAVKDSHVLKAMGLPGEIIKSGVRFSLGRPTTETEIDWVLAKLPEILG